MKKKTWWKLDHHLWSRLKKYNLENKKVLVALSGGADSMALAYSCLKVLGPENVCIAHFHHGDSENKEFRDEALVFCQQWCQKKGVSFFSQKNQLGNNPSSEAEMRELRYKFLLKTAEEQNISVIMTGHHAEDVLETRLMRVIRGTGPQGLKAIKTFRPPFFRPFLKISRREIELYINKENLKFLTDPSNSDSRYFRNWLRITWLPLLEEKRPGSLRVLARSFDSIVSTLARQEPQISGDNLSRSEFLAKTSGEQKQWLAAVLLHIGQRNFTQFHLEEIRRRVAESPKNNSFRIAGCHWQINAQQILVQLDP